MPSAANLKILCPVGSANPSGGKLIGLRRALRRWFPLVLPWSSPARLTGAVICEGEGALLVHGRLWGADLRIETGRPLAQQELVPGSLTDLAEEPVCVCLPRQRTMVRHFRVPADSETEIEAMVPHLLTSELPLSLENFSWVWRTVAVQKDGTRLIAVHVARNDSLDGFLTPLLQAGLEVVGLVPEGWVWAHAFGQVRQRRGDAEDGRVRSLLVKGDNGPYLVVERSGEFMFDFVLSAAALGPDGQLNWDGPGCAEVRAQFADHFRLELPRPEIWPDELTESGKEGTDPFFGASVAAAGLGNKRLLAPPGMNQDNRRRVIRRTLAGLGRVAVLVILIWLVLGLYQDRQTRRSLAELNQRLAAEQPTVAALETQLQAVLANTRERAGSAQVLRALTSLRRHVKSPIYLENLEYMKGRGITLRGGAPSSSAVLEMTETLSADRVWRGLRVLQLRSEQTSEGARVHFVVEDQLN